MTKLFIFAFLSIATLSALSGADSANAYSTELSTTDTLELVSPDGLTTIDVSDDSDNDWRDLLYTANIAPYRCESADKTYMIGAVNLNDNYSVSQIVGSSEVYNYVENVYPTKSVYISYSNAPSSVTLDDAGGSFTYLNSQTSVRHAMLYVNNSGTIYLICQNNSASPSPSNMGMTAPNNNWVAGEAALPLDVQLYYTLETVIYPVGWTGSDVPGAPPAPDVVSNFTPSFYVSVSKNWLASIHDTNFNTIDDVPFTCNNGNVPVVHYELWDYNTEPESKLWEGYQSASAQIDYQFPVTYEEQDYQILGWYSCGPSPELQFNKTSFYDIKLTKEGSLYVIGLENCMKEEFPFIDMQSCLEAFDQMLFILSFELANPSSSIKAVSQNDSDSCYTLGTLGRWINQEGTEVCPAFSQEVRNTITPFVTFILGGTVFYYLTRGSRQVID